jgi:chromosomal replication initiator protein
MFNPRYTFELFVVVNNNNFVYAAAKAVAEAPGKSYNPLFIYGGVGLGKTHLLHAIGNHVSSSKRNIRVTYLSAEKFASEYIYSVQNSQLVKFRKKYRETGVLLIDDIQFLFGKKRIQEELSRTFDALHQAHKQIVMVGNCSPKEIQELVQRLLSRFEWGLLIDLQPPCIDSRLAHR